MRFSTRHSLLVRLFVCLVAALTLVLPPAALARGVKAPSRSFAKPAKVVKPKAKPKKSKKRPAPQRVVIKRVAPKHAKKTAKKKSRR